MGVTPETIDGYFQEYGWTFQRPEGGRDWQTAVRCDVAVFRIAVRLTDNWVFFTMVPFVLGPRDPQCTERLYRHLLRLNRDITLAKFALDEDGDVLLTVELPAKDLSYETFCDAIGALTYYADDTYVELLNLALMPGAPSRYDANG